MSVSDCLIKLVAAGKITQRTADQARDMHERMGREFARTLPPASADAAAALAAAKALRTSSADKIRNIHAQVNAFKAGETRLTEHPAGRKAALAGMMSRDLWRDTNAMRDLPDTSPVKTGMNVDYLSRVVTRDLYQKFAAGVEAFEPGYFGSTQQQTASLRNMIRELFGVGTGDATAAASSRAWTAAADQGVQWAQAAGKIFTPLDDWRLPQGWRSWRVKQLGFDEFRRDVLDAENRGGLVLFNRDTSKPVSNADRLFVLERAFEDITQTGGSSAPFTREARTFNFQPGQAGADAYMRLMEKYGYGTNPMQALTGHLDQMGREIALMRVFGPSPEANFRALMRQVKAAPEIPIAAVGSGLERYNPARLMAKWTESPNVLEGMWKVISGQVHATHDDFVSGVMAGLRNMNVAGSLRQAIFSVLPTDAVTSLLAANHLGMEGIGHMARVFTGGVSKADAAHLNIMSHNVMDFVNGVRDYENHLSAMQVTGKLASGVTRATGLDWWGQMGKRTWAADMLNLLAQQSGKAFDRADPKFRAFLTAYGFSPADWDRLRAGSVVDLNGARYLDPGGMDRDLYERMMGAIEEQGAYAMHQPDVRLRSIETGAAYGASGRSSEIMRSLMQFKTFALSRMTTQLMRIFTSGPIENRVFRGAAFTIASLAAGAASVQSLQILNGKDPFDFGNGDFWGKAFVKGGIGGFYGDLVEAALRGERSSGDVMAALAGPAAGLMTDALRMVAAPVHEELSDTQNVRRSTAGRQAIGLIKRATPSTWYARLATDRLIWDQLQTLVDPDYRTSWLRMEQQQRRQGSGYWWAPGETAPERMPSFTH